MSQQFRSHTTLAIRMVAPEKPLYLHACVRTSQKLIRHFGRLVSRRPLPKLTLLAALISAPTDASSKSLHNKPVLQAEPSFRFNWIDSSNSHDKESTNPDTVRFADVSCSDKRPWNNHDSQALIEIGFERKIAKNNHRLHISHFGTKEQHSNRKVRKNITEYIVFDNELSSNPRPFKIDIEYAGQVRFSHALLQRYFCMS